MQPPGYGGGTMPLTERDPNISGRNSRASNMSASSRGYQKVNVARSDFLCAAPGVMSMLRTSTELGSIGSLTFDSSHLPSLPWAQQQGSGANSRMSTSSPHSQASRRTTNHNPWPSASSNPRVSLTRDVHIPQLLPDTLSTTLMNTSGTSPLVPLSRLPRYGRSFSLTHTSQPPYPLSSNRSYTSLRNHDYGPRPRSPYRYPNRLRHYAYLPGSPAMSDVTGVHPHRVHGHPYGPRLRTPSIQSTHSDDRSRGPYRQGRSRSNTSSSSGIVSNPPPLFIEQVRRVRTPALGSTSSGSTNQRTDSEAPSSDSPSSLPTTPKDGTSMEVLLSPTGTEMLVKQIEESVKSDVSPMPLYYDYSEQFDREALSDPEPGTIPLGFVHRIKTILEERSTPDTAAMLSQTQQVPAVECVRDFAELPASEVAVLPAYPVARRITRHMILAAIEPESITDEMTTLSLAARSSNRISTRGADDLDGSCTMAEDTPISIPSNQGKFQTVVVESASKDSESSEPNSTLDFAIIYSMTDKLDEDQEVTQNIHVEEAPQANAEDRVERHMSIKTAHSSKFSEGKSFIAAKDTIIPDRNSASVPVMSSRPFERPVSKLIKRPSSATVLASSSVESNPPVSFIAPSSDSSSSGEAPKSRAVADFLLRLSRLRRSNRQSFTKDDAADPKSTKADRSSKDGHSEKRVTRFESLVKEEAPPRRQSDRVDWATKDNYSNEVPDLTESTICNSTWERKHSRATSLSQGIATSKQNIGAESSQNIHTRAKSSNGGQSLLSINSFKKHHSRMKSHAKEQGPFRVAFVGENAFSLKAQTPEHYDVSPMESSIPEPSSTPCPFIDNPSVYVTDAQTPPSSEEPTPSGKSPSLVDNARRDSNTTTHLVWNSRKALPPILTETNKPHATYRQSHDESTTDLRLSTFRYPAAYLPDVKEDLHENSSINTSVSNLKSSRSNFKHPMSRIPSMRMSMDECPVLKHPSIKSYQKGRLARTRNLPSLNFSQMDLFAKLNEAPDSDAGANAAGGASRSMDYAEEYRDLFLSPFDDPESTGAIREKYKSLFGSLDSYAKPEYLNPGTPIFNLVVPHRSTIDLEGTNRPLSRDDLLAEIDNLTIPSLGGLTQRLSEFLPSLRRYYQGEDPSLDDEDTIMEHALERLNEVGIPALNTVRSSARLRPVPGHPSLVLIEDGLYEKLANPDASNRRFADANDQAGGSKESVYSKRSSSLRRREKTPLAELEAPMPVMLHTRSLPLGGNDELRASLESRITRRSPRSLLSSRSPTTETRPWNLDKNYPWADTIPPIDISLPAPSVIQDASRPGPSRLRQRVSDSTDHSDSSYDNDEPTRASVINDTTCDDPFRHGRKTSKHSLISSITGRVGLHSPPFDNSGYPTGPNRLRNDDRSVDPGDRYPTTGLTPPSAFNIETRSFFSDDSSQHHHRSGTGTFRKRVTHLKARLPPVTRSHSAIDTQSLPDMDVGSTADAATETEGGSSLHTFDGTVGMSKLEFRARKVVERIKALWFKGGDLFRTMSGRRRSETGA